MPTSDAHTDAQTISRVERPAMYRVLMSDLIFEELGAGVTWGEPDPEGFYTPTVHTATWDQIAPLDKRIRDLERGIRALLDSGGYGTFTPEADIASQDLRRLLDAK